MTSRPHHHDVDLLVVGAGPAGLFATYYAGFRGLSVALADALPELGGQITAMYPHKPIRDVAGFPDISGTDLVAGLVRQAATAHPAYLLGRVATTLEARDDGVDVSFDDGTTVSAGALLLTTGIGRFRPRPLPAAGEEWTGRGVDHFITEATPYAGVDVLVVGGGDSALDWSLHLAPVARSVTLAHRRDAFRAHAGLVAEARAAGVEILTQAQVAAVRGNGHVEEVDLDVAGETRTLAVQRIVAALGFVADPGPLERWGLALDQHHVVVDSAMRTNLPRVFAAGDITSYAGKVRLIAVGFGEAATAVNNAAVAIDPAAHLFPGHSTDAS
ncbi:ferredoxin--NADP reductase [Nocardioides phosphati]|uniref:Ferredoxin--NADP reductase n=1 Tax=Nocardioides phosphati TaxID=1867775 RepID=A0ABQ2NB43_9ACTN|nr:NAD(P)/FAD-dependent oxidoreductase [Nocardioides phosphati]GGO91227.1 ferredoxin--NADP reductase [Nocardioides phosphati]